MENGSRTLPQARNLAVKVMRERRGLRQNELMRRVGLCKSAMTHLESGRLAVSAKTLSRIAATLKFSPEELEWLAVTLSVFTGEPDLPPSANGLSPKVRGEIGAEAARRARAVFASTLEELIDEGQAQRYAEERKEATRLYREMAGLPLPRQETRLEERAELQTWAMVERLCEESEKAAGDEPKRALILAGLALRCAQSAGIPKSIRPRLEGFAWAFIANARRVASDIPAAEEAFRIAWECWRKVKVKGPAIPLGAWRIYDLEASLRRDQGQGRQALQFVNKALKVAPPSARGMLFLKKATIHEFMGNLSSAIAVLKECEGSIDKRTNPRLYLALRFNLAVNLELVGDAQAAQTLISELRELATALRSDVNLTRILWIQARIHERAGMRDQAIAGLEQVCLAFCGWGMAHDAALASLELAVLLLEEKQVSRVRNLAQETLRIFRAQRLEQGMLASLVVFFDAALRDEATVVLARVALDELRKAHLSEP